MIDSVIWKEKLEQDSRVLKRRATQRRWSYRSMVLFERELILIFCTIRCLIETGKLTDSLARRKFDCTVFPNKSGIVVDDYTKYWVEENYDLDEGLTKRFPLRFLANQFIHAYVIYPDFWISKQIEGVVVCSDWEKYNSLIQISFDTLIKIVDSVIMDQITSIHLERDEKTHELRKVRIS